MSKIQNSTEVGGWDVWVTHAGGDPSESGDETFVATCSTLAEACVELLNAIAAEEKDALREAAAEIAKIEEQVGPRAFDAALLEVVLKRAKGAQ